MNLESFKEINEDEEDDNIHLKEKKNKQKRRLTLSIYILLRYFTNSKLIIKLKFIRRNQSIKRRN